MASEIASPAEVSTPTARKPNRARLPALGLITLAALGTAAYRAANAGKESTDDAFVEGRVMPIASRVVGQVTKVLVKDNQLVELGELLVECGWWRTSRKTSCAT